MKVDCNHCGASLSVGESTRFVTCQGCASRLELKRTGSAIYTEVLGDRDDDEIEDRQVGPVSKASATSPAEGLLHLVVGGLVIASDIYWWITDPTLQSLFARIMLLAAGFGLCVSGVLKLVTNLRASRRAAGTRSSAGTPPS